MGAFCYWTTTFIIKRLPVWLTYDINYFNDRYHEIPDCITMSSSKSCWKELKWELNTDFFADRENMRLQQLRLSSLRDDWSLFDYQFGELEYRSSVWAWDSGPRKLSWKCCSQLYWSDIPIRVSSNTNILSLGLRTRRLLPRISSRLEKRRWTYYPINDAKNNAIYEQYL